MTFTFVAELLRDGCAGAEELIEERELRKTNRNDDDVITIMMTYHRIMLMTSSHVILLQIPYHFFFCDDIIIRHDDVITSYTFAQRYLGEHQAKVETIECANPFEPLR